MINNDTSMTHTLTLSSLFSRFQNSAQPLRRSESETVTVTQMSAMNEEDSDLTDCTEDEVDLSERLSALEVAKTVRGEDEQDAEFTINEAKVHAILENIEDKD